MRHPRFKMRSEYPVAYYHCLSRVVERRYLLGDEEKEQFVGLLVEYARFCGLRLVTYCVMSNHFHVLVEVPRRPETPLSDEALLRRLEALSGMTQAGTIREQLETFRKRGQHDAADALRDRLLVRMWDISAFMKLIKQRFTQWYNRHHGRKGTLWEERFKSVLVEGAGDTLATVAAYIDLNPVRADLVTDPKDYPFCGYAAAMRGDPAMREGLRTAVGEVKESDDPLAVYRVWLFGPGERTAGGDAEGKSLRQDFDREKGLDVVAAKGKLVLADYLRMRVRYFADGAVMGSREYVDEVFAGSRERFGPKRKDGARKMRYLDGTRLYVLRDLQLNVLG